MSSWKHNERAFAKWAESWVRSLSNDNTFELRRNASSLDAFDASRNSDVDVIHPAVAKGTLEGITAELTRRSSGLTTLYRWYDSIKTTNRPSLLVLNDTWFCMSLDSFSALWEGNTPYYSFDIKHVDSQLTFKVLEEKTEQSRRYGTTKNLFPIVVVRAHNRYQMVIVNIADYLSIAE